MNMVKWAVFALSLLLLLKCGLARRAGSVLRAMLSRFGLLLVALCVITLPTVGPQTVSVRSTVEAEGACSRVVPVDALAGSTVGYGAAGAFVVGSFNTAAPTTVAVVAGGAAPATASLGTVGLATATFLAASYGTCKWLDWIVGDAMDGNEAQPTISQSNSTLTASAPCQDRFPGTVPTQGDVPPLATDRCVMVTFPAGTLPDGMTFNSTRFGQKTSGANTLPGADFSKTQQYGPMESGTTNYGGSSTQHLSWLNVSSYYWCQAQVVGANCQQTAPNSHTVASRILYKFRCVGNIGGVCGRHPGEIYYGQRVSPNQNDGFHFIYSLFPEARDKGWSRRIITDVQCYGSGWVRAESATYFDRIPSARIEMPSCPSGTRPITIRTWRIPTGITCGAAGMTFCWDSAAKIGEWNAPTTWSGVGTAPAWITCLNAGTDCGVPVELNGSCTWGGFAAALSMCDPAKQAGLNATPLGVPKAEPTTVPAAYTVGQPIASTNTVTETPPTTTVPPSGDGAAIDPGEGPRGPGEYDDGGDDPCLPSGWGWLNPVEWVLKPVKCAMVWAFVPEAEVVQGAWTDLLDQAATNAPIAWAYQSHEMISGSSAGMAAAVAANEDGCIEVVPAGGDLIDSDPGLVCPSAMGVGSFAAARPWLGYAVWLAWAFAMYGALFRKAPASSEPEQLSLF